MHGNRQKIGEPGRQDRIIQKRLIVEVAVGPFGGREQSPGVVPTKRHVLIRDEAAVQIDESSVIGEKLEREVRIAVRSSIDFLQEPGGMTSAAQRKC